MNSTVYYDVNNTVTGCKIFYSTVYVTIVTFYFRPNLKLKM